ncbi:MAG: hypothetical protein NC924_01690 [Candidatus Omnitrophica bacterium]|nr:hypothetical protein [Candidatus Omnitrophota bacterium]
MPLRCTMYVVAGLVVVASVVWKQQDVRSRRAETIVSMATEWEKAGKPVVVAVAERRPVAEYVKMTVRPSLPRGASGFVVREIRDRLAAGQDVYWHGQPGMRVGQIDAVAAAVDRSRGMFAVRLLFDQELAAAPEIMRVRAHVRTIPDALAVPPEAVRRAGDAWYVWKVSGTRVVKTAVTVAARTADTIVIRSGLVPGDRVVCRGQTLLVEGDTVRIQAEVQENGND